MMTNNRPPVFTKKKDEKGCLPPADYPYCVDLCCHYAASAHDPRPLPGFQLWVSVMCCRFTGKLYGMDRLQPSGHRHGHGMCLGESTALKAKNSVHTPELP